MLRTTLKLVMLAAMVIAGVVGLWTYEKRNSVQIQLDQERKKSQQLSEIVAHLQASDRIADVIVTDQRPSPTGSGVQATLLFVEYAKDGSPLPAKRFVIEGKMAHIDAMVVNFDGRYVESRDPLRGKSVALF